MSRTFEARPGGNGAEFMCNRVAGGARAVSPIKMTKKRVLVVDGQTTVVVVLLVKLDSQFEWKVETEQT